MTDPLDLGGQVAVVTGGGGGIGRAIALRLAEAGADVAVVDIVPERCDEGVARIAGFGRNGLALPCDVMDSDALDAMILYFSSDASRNLTGSVMTIDDGQTL